jgi:purine nucleosidase
MTAHIPADGDSPAAVRVIIDTDCSIGEPGAKVDDGFALALALASPELDVQLVTTAGGNVDVVTATTRTRAFLERLRRPDVPVVAGGPPDGTVAAGVIASRALADPGSITIVAMAPLTTVALALDADPEIASALREVVVMGGRFDDDEGAIGEFNTSFDPWATRAVVESRVAARFLGLDVTTRLALEPADLDRLGEGGACAQYLAAQARARLSVLAAEGVTACPMHDVAAVLAVVQPSLFSFEPATVTVDVGTGASRGTTRAHRFGAVATATASVATDVDAPAARRILLDRLAALP